MMIALFLALHLGADPCAFSLDGPIDLSRITYDRSRLRDLTDRAYIEDFRLARSAKRFERAARDVEAATARLGLLDRWSVAAGVPLNAEVRRAFKTRLRLKQARLARNLDRDRVTWLSIERRGLLSAHPEFSALNQAQSDAFSVACDVTHCLEEVKRLAARIARVRGTEEWELNHAFDPKFTERVEYEMEVAHVAMHEIESLWDRALDGARALGLQARSVSPTSEHLGPGSPLSHLADEVAHFESGVRELELRLMDLRARIEARIDAYLLYALEH